MSRSAPFFMLMIFLFSIKAYSFDIKNKDETYYPLIKEYVKWKKLDKEIFQMFSFEISPQQLITSGTTPKLSFHDDFGDKWIFKPRDFKSKSTEESIIKAYGVDTGISVIISNIYKLFGLDTPIIYPLMLNINGNQIRGSIQRFVDSKGNLSKTHPYKLSKKSYDYILKTHVIDWIFGNHDAKYSHFLIISKNKKGEPENVVRIDNDSYFFSDEINLTKDWSCPDEGYCNRYYYYMWQDYVSGSIVLDLAKNMWFVQYVSDFPDEILDKIILGEEINLSQEDSFDVKETNYDLSWYLENIHKRKKRLLTDFKKFYKDLAKEKNIDKYIEKDINYKEMSSFLCKKISKDIKYLKKKKLMFKKKDTHINAINAVFSLDGFVCLKSILSIYEGKNKGNLLIECDKSLEKLENILANVNNEYEQTALKIYINEIKKIKQGDKPSVKFDMINTLITEITIIN